VDAKPERLIGDKAYDCDGLDRDLKQQGIELIAPHKQNRQRAKTQDGRKLRRYRNRWKIERLFAWLQNYRRILYRHDYYPENFLGFLHLGCLLIYLKNYF
jgi:transposase